jgi:LysR family cyn operon transcriptional activator
MVLIGHSSHSLTKQQSVAPKDLQGHPLVLFGPETPTRRAIDRFFRKHGVRPNVVMELDHIATLMHAVEVDIGLSIVPVPAVESRDTLKALSFKGDPFVRPLGILHRRGRSFSVATQKLLEVLTEGKQIPDPGRKRKKI